MNLKIVYIYTKIYINLRFEMVFMTKSFLFHIKTRVWKKLHLLYIYGRFYNGIYFTSMILYILTINNIEMDIKCTINNGGKCLTLIRRDILWSIPQH